MGNTSGQLVTVRRKQDQRYRKTLISTPVFMTHPIFGLIVILPDCSPDALSPSLAAAFLADMAGAGTPGPSTPMHVDEAVQPAN